MHTYKQTNELRLHTHEYALAKSDRHNTHPLRVTLAMYTYMYVLNI